MGDVILPAGTRLYKGFGAKSVGCKTLLNDTRIFFATQSPRVARAYGSVCPFLTRRALRLFVLNHTNIKNVFKYLKSDTRTGLQFALGTNVTRGQQALAYQKITRTRLPQRYRNKPQAPGQRLSVTNINGDVFRLFARDYLLPQGYDGFYSSAKRTGFHGGLFPAEIMLCDAGRTLVRAGPDRAPVLSRISVIRELPQLYIKYCRKNRTLLRVYRNLFVPLLGGGMGVKLYLEARGLRAPKKVIDTRDFDFTFAVSKKLSKREARRRASIMKYIMFRHVTGFVAWLNSRYTRTNARISIFEFVPDIKVIPATKKELYHVTQFRIQFPGQEPMDFVDSTLAYVPGSSREDIHPVYARMYGLPIERLKKLYDSVLTVLAGSFVYPGIKPRNPIYGRHPEKGQKNTARLAALQNLAPKNRSVVRNLISRIKKRDVSGAKRNANKIIKNIQRQ